MFNNGSCTSSPREKERVRDKLKSICCFRTTDHAETGQELEELKPRSPRSPYTWLRSRISRHGSGRKQTAGSSDFSYDPLSYALNFEDETGRDRDGEMPFSSFSSRLQATPDRLFEANCKSEPPVTASSSRAIVLCS